MRILLTFVAIIFISLWGLIKEGLMFEELKKDIDIMWEHYRWAAISYAVAGILIGVLVGKLL